MLPSSSKAALAVADVDDVIVVVVVVEEEAMPSLRLDADDTRGVCRAPASVPAAAPAREAVRSVASASALLLLPLRAVGVARDELAPDPAAMTVFEVELEVRACVRLAAEVADVGREEEVEGREPPPRPSSARVRGVAVAEAGSRLSTPAGAGKVKEECEDEGSCVLERDKEPVNGLEDGVDGADANSAGVGAACCWRNAIDAANLDVRAVGVLVVVLLL